MPAGREAKRRLLRTRGAVHLTHAGAEAFEDLGDLAGEFAPIHLDRAALDQVIPGLREQWTGAWYEGTCADIEVAAFHNACLAAVRRGGGVVRTDAELLRARETDGGWRIETSAGEVEAADPGQCRRRLGRPGRDTRRSSPASA